MPLKDIHQQCSTTILANYPHKWRPRLVSWLTWSLSDASCGRLMDAVMMIDGDQQVKEKDRKR
ncbi:hypothetical protein TYRP_019351 [Tyrophagus putrescentiae]|nr:hypothetical protein TYRP_019351 [Tyrophagus putrescentiae]